MTATALQMKMFDDVYPDAPKTEGIKYAGSKMKLLPQILWLAEKVRPKTVFDGFSGSTRVSQALARVGYRVTSSDQAIWSETFARCYLQSGKREQYTSLIKHLNACKPVDGWFTQYYGGDPQADLLNGGDVKKRPWQIQNTRKLDAIREEIDRLQLDPNAKAVALTSLILALDKVDSTLGHFSSYLRDWSPRSYKTMQLEMPLIVDTALKHTVNRGDIFEVAPNVDVDLAYLDPPYGSNNEKMPPSRVRYSAYYHVWTTVCLNDKPPLFGKVHRREDTRDEVAASVFEEFRRAPSGKFIAVDAIHRLLKVTAAKHIILSYSSGGRATSVELNEALRDVGKIIEVIELDYRRNVMATMTWTNEWLREAQEPNREFLFLIKRS